jgi:hypothetical protein
LALHQLEESAVPTLSTRQTGYIALAAFALLILMLIPEIRQAVMGVALAAVLVGDYLYGTRQQQKRMAEMMQLLAATRRKTARWL